MYYLRDHRGVLKALIPNDVAMLIIEQRRGAFFAGVENKTCFRIEEDTAASARMGPNQSKIEIYLWRGDYLAPV